MIKEQTRKAYYEILVLLKYLPRSYTNVLPNQLLQIFRKYKIQNEEFMIDIKNPLNKNFLSKETLEILAMLNYNYWCSDENQKQKLYEIYSTNEQFYQKQLVKQYDIETIFNKKKSKYAEHDNNEKLDLIVYKESFLRKIIKKLKKIIK